MKSWIASGTLLLFSAVVPVRSQTTTSDVFRTQALLQGVIEYEVSVTETIHPVQLTGSDLVNLALGRVLGTKLRTNEVFACGASSAMSNLKVFVYDSNTASNLATIGLITPEATVAGLVGKIGNTRPSCCRTVSEMIAEMTVPGAGNATNGLTGGNFLLDGISILDTNGSLVKFNAKMIGVLNTAVTGALTNLVETNIVVDLTNVTIVVTNVFVGSTNIPVLVHSATLTTKGKKIGTLIDGP